MFTGNKIKTKGKPIKGYRIMTFTLLMMFLLIYKISYERYYKNSSMQQFTSEEERK